MPSDILAVFDCVTLVQSAISQAGPAVRCLELFEQKRIKLAVSTETLAQISEVLSRPVLRKRFPELTEVKAQRLMVLLVNRGMLFRNVHRHYEFSRDPSDECYLNLAMEARADFVVTRDRDLLDLMKWSTEEGREFQKRFRWLKIVDPVTFLREVDRG